jgi:tetratricopeptide (TPR) repeat protein
MDIEYNNNAQKYKELGNQAYKNQDYNRAISYYTKAIEADPSEPNFFSNRSLCFYNLNKYEQCIQDCEKALSLNPNFVKVLKKKSQACLNILKFNEAVEAAKQVVTIERSTSANNEL